MLTRIDVEAILAEIGYKDWEVRLGWDDGHWEGSACAGDLYWVDGTDNWIQVRFHDKGKLQSCRKWRLSVHMTTSEVVQTVFAAIKAAEEHETREKFLYKGVNIFGPHFSVDQLAEALHAGDLGLDVR